MNKILIACEQSGILRSEFRKLGYDAWSCDLLPAEDGDPHHLQMDMFDALKLDAWHQIHFFPPCTHLAVSGARWFPEKRADGRQGAAIQFFMACALNECPRWSIENPIGIMSTLYRKPDQIIQPFQYGHGETKATCLWLKGLPLLVPTDIVEGREARIHRMAPGPDRSKERSKTYPGIARAMSVQWSPQ